MKYKDYLELHYDFFKAIILQMGLYCPLKCRHCSVFAGPRRRERMPPELATRIISDFAQSPEATLVVLTGGEPFAMMDCLVAALSEVASFPNLSSYVITSGHWACSADQAVSILRSLPEIALMMVSADSYHEDFVPLENVRNAVYAARSLGRDVVLSIATGEDQQPYVGKVRECVGERLWNEIEIEVVRVHPTGRAKNYGIGSFGTVPATLPEGACDVLGTPVFVHDGNAVVCCQIDVVNEASRKTESPYHIGNAYEDTLGTLRERTENDVLMQALRVWGPSELARLLHRAGVRPQLAPAYDGVCFLCRDLLTRPDVLAHLRNLLNVPGIRDQIRLSRMLQYGELRPCPVGMQ